MLTGDGPLYLDIPRDRQGSFQLILIPQHERRFTGSDDKIIAMYARGMTVRDIRAFLSEQYGTDVYAHCRDRWPQRHARSVGGGVPLTAFERGPWGERHPTVVATWRRA